MRGGARGHGGKASDVHAAGHHILGSARTGIAVDRDRGVLVHASDVVADMTVNLHIEVGIETHGDGMGAIGVSHLNVRYPVTGRLPVQKIIQVPQITLRQIEFADLGHRPQIRHE